MSELSAIVKDAGNALKTVRTSQVFGIHSDKVQVFRLTWRRNIKEWIYVPFGILLMLLACFGVNSIIRLSSVQFPASVACLIVLFLLLLLCDCIVGERKTRQVVSIIDIPVCSKHDEYWPLAEWFRQDGLCASLASSSLHRKDLSFCELGIY